MNYFKIPFLYNKTYIMTPNNNFRVQKHTKYCKQRAREETYGQQDRGKERRGEEGERGEEEKRERRKGGGCGFGSMGGCECEEGEKRGQG